MNDEGPIRVRSSALAPGDVFESDGSTVISVEPVGQGIADVLITYLRNAIPYGYIASAAQEHLVRRR